MKACRQQIAARGRRPSSLTIWIAIVGLGPLAANGDSSDLAQERRAWLADKRSDPLDLQVEPAVERLHHALVRGDCAAALVTAQGVLRTQPFQLAALDAVARCADSEAERVRAANRRDAIVGLIERSGTGADLFSPWQVASWTEPFEFLRLKQLRAEDHRVGCGRTEHLIVTARSADGSLDRYYFDIHSLYRACRTQTGCRVEDRDIPCAIAPR